MVPTHKGYYKMEMFAPGPQFRLSSPSQRLLSEKRLGVTSGPHLLGS